MFSGYFWRLGFSELIIGSNWFDGLCVWGSVYGLMVCVCVCVALCVVAGLDRLIGISWVCVCVCVGFCVLNRCWRLREKERKKKDCWKA